MPAFLNKVFRRDHSSKKASGQTANDQNEPKYVDGWLRTEVAPEEVQELLRVCTHEVKLRGLSAPFLLLPFRPGADPNAAKNFIRNFFDPASGSLTGARLQQELRLTETDVLCGALKWCWGRLPGGVVTWDVYELFRQGEVDSSMARDAFATFIPISTESPARSKIIFDYFDLLSAIAANGKHNGLTGVKLSRLAGWWAFEQSDTGFGFEGGYASWTAAADATCHLFFAYLRSLSPTDPSKSVSLLPTSLRALLASIEYPPATPQQLQSRATRVALTVDKVAPSLFSLLRRAGRHHYQPGNSALRIFTDHDDPIRAMTDECRRVWQCIAGTGSSVGLTQSFKTTTGMQDQAWSRFQDLGFAGLSEEQEEVEDSFSDTLSQRRMQSSGTNNNNEAGQEIVRPMTPSWADFMDAGFGDREVKHAPAPLLLPPDKILPPIATSDRARSSQSNRKMTDSDLEPGELDTVTPMDLDDAFWWVWISSLAGEETAARKAVFGRCALAETSLKGARWLLVEEKVRGAAKLDESALAKKEKKRSKLNKLRRKSLNSRIETPPPAPMKQFNPSMPTMNRSNIGPDQTAKIQAAAAALRRQQADSEYSQLRRAPPRENTPATRTNSVFTLQPMIMSEASPAMKWANRYDRDTLRDAYLKGTPLPERKTPAPSELERPLPPIQHEEVSRTESPVPPPPARKDTPPPAPEPLSPKSNRHTIAPSSPSANGHSFPPADKRASMSTGSQAYTVPSTSDKGKQQQQKVSRLRALFGKKAEVTGVEGGSSSHLIVPSAGTVRKTSLRKKHSPIQAPRTHTPEPEPTTSPAVEEPLVQFPEPEDERREQEAQIAFSAFSQGPLEDQPAFMPESPSVSRNSPSPAPSPVPVMDEPVVESSPPTSGAPVVDRWAQIRKNAAERAKVAPKVSDDLSTTDARGSLDDGETSGEETIESRVARIKARVAELTVLEARLEQAGLLKKIVDAIKDLVQDCNFDCNDSGLSLQAMDNSHVALVAMQLKAEGFSPYRCDRNVALGINLAALAKILRAAQNEDLLTVKAEDTPDVLSLVFENSENDRISEYDIKLMDIDQEHLGIPETEYAATVTLPSGEFQRICRDLNLLSESVSIEATKEGVKFSCQGDIGSGAVTLRQNNNVEKPDLSTTIELQEPVALTFSLKYLVNFTKATGLSNTVTLQLSQEVPLLVEYKMESGYVRFYLAPKIGDDE